MAIVVPERFPPGQRVCMDVRQGIRTMICAGTVERQDPRDSAARFVRFDACPGYAISVQVRFLATIDEPQVSQVQQPA